METSEVSEKVEKREAKKMAEPDVILLDGRSGFLSDLKENNLIKIVEKGSSHGKLWFFVSLPVDYAGLMMLLPLWWPRQLLEPLPGGDVVKFQKISEIRQIQIISSQINTSTPLFDCLSNLQRQNEELRSKIRSTIGEIEKLIND